MTAGCRRRVGASRRGGSSSLGLELGTRVGAATVGYELARGHRDQGPAVLERAWRRCRPRLHRRRQRMAGRGKRQQAIVVAGARDQAGFVGAIAPGIRCG
jgi:hypothetical protein